MELGLKGKRVVITGGTRGIGRAIADALAGEGASVALCARNAQQVEETLAHFRQRGATAFGDALDIADHGALQAWIGRAAEKLGGMDIVIANPSSFGIGATEADWQAGYAVDLMGSVHTVEAAMPHLESAAATFGDAAALIITSALVAEAETESAYGAYKAALVHYAKGASRRLAPKKVRVNAISPGTIYFEDGFWGNARRHMPAIYDAFLKRNPMGRMGTGEEVAGIAAFLCSPAASFITGANIMVDGGFTSRVNY